MMGQQKFPIHIPILSHHRDNWGFEFYVYHLYASLYTFIICIFYVYISVQFSSVTQLCPTLCDPMDCSTPGLPVHYQLPKFTQTHAH